MQEKKSKERYNNKYRSEKTKSVTTRFFLNNKDDARLLEHVKSQENRNQYIKRLIREDMERGDD